MAIDPGARLGVYEIGAKIGAGGMGEVYRARDTKLDRVVAIKVLPAAVAADAERIARFEREAKTLASLNHPGIAVIFGFEEADAAAALVMELVEGPTLSERLEATGSGLPVDEVLSIAKQIAEALEAAHEQGIIHRDLKPANIKVKPDGTVKLLDFGLAKAMELAPAQSAEQAAAFTQTPTLTTPAMTQAGIILGTAAYMSPEQAKGAAVTRTADIWAFGVVLLEMLTGQQPFAAPTVSESLARVLEREVQLETLPAHTPASVRRLLRRCLEKDPRQRLQHMGDARLELIEAREPEPVAQASRSRSALLWKIAAAVATLVAAVAVVTRGTETTPGGEVTRFTIQSATGEHISRSAPLALSPNGRRLVYAVGDQSGGGSGRLIVHNMDVGTGNLVTGVTAAAYPFFGPDGSTVAFSSPIGGLTRVSLAGGAPTPLAPSALSALGGSWSADGTVVSAYDWGQPLYVSKAGESALRPLTSIEASAGEGGHLYPQILPGGKAVLFSIWTSAASLDQSRLAIADLETGSHRVVLDGGVSGRYTASGHLVFWRGNALMAVPFDLDSLTVRGEPVKVVDGVRLYGSDASAHFAVSDSGTLAYVPGGIDYFSRSAITDRAGHELLRLDQTASVDAPVFSPDGRRVAVTILYGGVFHVGVYDLERGILTSIASTNDNILPAWTVDGTGITYLSNAEGEYRHYTVAADGSGQARALLPKEVDACCNNRAAWSPDGTHVILAMHGTDSQTGFDLWMLSSSSGSSAEPLITEPRDQTNPAFSPDGRFILYESQESGAKEIWMRPFPDVARGKVQVSQGGGGRPMWSHDGREILYINDRGIMRVPVLNDREPTMPRLGRAELALEMAGISGFDLSPDGQRFAISRFPVESAAKEIHVVLNWFSELERLVPTH